MMIYVNYIKCISGCLIGVTLVVTPVEVSRHDTGLEGKGAKFCIEITSLDKRENILITKQPVWLYYMAEKSEEYCKLIYPTPYYY